MGEYYCTHILAGICACISVCVCACSPSGCAKGQSRTSGRRLGTRSPHTPPNPTFPPFIHNRVNEICHHLALRLLWVSSFLCQVKIIEHGCIWPLGSLGVLGGPGWLICFYCRFSGGNVLDGAEDREEVTLAFRFVVRNVATTSSGFSSYLLKFALKMYGYVIYC